ncbi:MAG: hypothetical protein VW405_06095 [Rhodospirillaceae bacterium]
MLKATVLGWIRHALTTGGGALVAIGATNEQVELIVGALITFAGIAWSFVDKWLAERLPEPRP